jgi:hypothetical protein
MNTNIIIRKFEVEDFVMVDHGAEEVTLTLFHGRVEVGTHGWANEMHLSPDQAEAIGKELINRAKLVRKPNQGG